MRAAVALARTADQSAFVRGNGGIDVSDRVNNDRGRPETAHLGDIYLGSRSIFSGTRQSCRYARGIDVSDRVNNDGGRPETAHLGDIYSRFPK